MEQSSAFQGREQAPPHYYALDERVSNLSRQFSNLQSDLHGVRSSMASREDVVALAGKIDQLVKDFSDRSKPQWHVMFTAAGVITTIIMAIGGLAYLPISQTMSDIKTTISEDRVMFRPEVEQRWRLADERHKNLYDRVDRLEDKTFGEPKLPSTFSTAP